MATAKLLRQLIKTGTEGNQDAFKRVSEQLIQEERAKSHYLLANDLEKFSMAAGQLTKQQLTADRPPSQGQGAQSTSPTDQGGGSTHGRRSVV